MTLCCVYLRCSTLAQAPSDDEQWDDLQALAARSGRRIIQRYEDEGLSGTTMDRNGLKRLLADAANGAQWQEVLVWDRKRFSRPEDPREAIHVTYGLLKLGKKVVPLHGAQPTDNPIIDTMCELIEFDRAGNESIDKSCAVLRGQRDTARRGSIPNGKVPYGCDALYLSSEGQPVRRVRLLADRSKLVLSPDGGDVLRRVPRKDRLHKDPDEILILTPGDPEKASVVRRLFDENDAGFSPRRSAAGLNRDGILSPWGGAWGRSTVLRILRNPAYKGALVWYRQSWAKFHTITPDGQIERISNPKKQWTAKPEEQWVTLDGQWEALVDPEQWERVNTRLKRPKPRALRGRGANSSYLATGLLECTCGSHYTGCSYPDKRDRERRYEYYRCVGEREKGKAVCTAKSIRRGTIDGYLERRIRELYLQPTVGSSVWDELGRQLAVELGSLVAENPANDEQSSLADIEARIDRLVGLVESGDLAPEEVRSRLGPLRRQHEALRRQMAETSGSAVTIDAVDLRRRILEACQERVRRETELWPGATPSQKKQIVHGHVARIVVDQSRGLMRTEFIPLVETAGSGFQYSLSS